MNREIKLRVWDKEQNIFLETDDENVYWNCTNGILTAHFEDKNSDWRELEIIQFTGLKDKKGNDVFDGDLLREPAKSQWDEINYSCFEVFFHDNDCCSYHIGWQIDRMHNHGAIAGGYIPSFKPSVVSKMIIIGNIYENTELKTSV